MLEHKNKFSKLLQSSGKVVWILTFVDIFTWGLYVIVTSLSGLYLANKLDSDIVRVVGIGTSIHFVVRAFFQIPIGLILDKIKKDIDEIIILTVSVVIMGVSVILYPYIKTASFYYLLQFLFGIGASMNLVSWRKLFAKNLDENREGMQYAVYGAIMSLAIAIFGVVAGIFANKGQYYFDTVMTLMGSIIIVGSLLSLSILKVSKRKSFK